MEIISWNFLFFILVVAIVYYSLNHKAQNFWLLITSIYFFATWGWSSLIPLVIIAFITYLIGNKLTKDNKKFWLIIGISINVFFFILYRLITGPLLSITSKTSASTSLSFINQYLIPIGFSFYVLQALSYLIDLYKSKIQAETSFVDFFTYLIFFPKVLAGPIERPGNFLPQLKKERKVDNQKLAQGFALILIGLFRKMVVADVIFSILPTNYIHAPVTNTHAAIGILSFAYISYTDLIPYANRLVGIIAYGIYLYNDFAGYTGIVRGISLLMGFNLSPNFRVPFFSTSLSDLWGRWHISLSSWLRDYIYFPLTRFIKMNNPGISPVFPIFIPLFATMLISGFWHGLTAPLLLWGFYYAVLMSLEQFAFQKWPVLRPQQQPIFFKVIGGLLTFLIVSLSWVPFSATSTDEMLAFWKVIIKGSGWNIPPSFNFWILPLVFLSFLIDYFQSRYNDEIFILKWPLLARATVMAIYILIMILSTTWTSQYVSKVFVYQGF